MTLVAHLTTAHPVRDNRIFRKECAALVDAGFDVTLVAVHNKSEIIDSVSVESLPERNSRISRMLIGPIDAWKVLKKIQPKIVHGHDPELIPLLIAYRLLNRDSRVIYDAHESLTKQIAGKSYIPSVVRPAVELMARLLEKLADHFLDGIVVATPHISESFRNSNTTLVQNFPWLRDFPDPSPYPTNNYPTKLTYVGAISRGRGSELLSKLPSITKVPTRLVVAGILSEDARNDIVNSTNKGIDFLGKLPAETIPRVISEANIGLCMLLPLPNYLESQATKIYEYMAAARPFIASNFPYWMSLFEEQNCGIFVDPHDQHAVSRAIDKLANNPEFATAMGLNGRRAIEDKFSFEKEALRLVELVNRLSGA